MQENKVASAAEVHSIIGQASVVSTSLKMVSFEEGKHFINTKICLFLTPAQHWQSSLISEINEHVRDNESRSQTSGIIVAKTFTHFQLQRALPGLCRIPQTRPELGTTHRRLKIAPFPHCVQSRLSCHCCRTSPTKTRKSLLVFENH